MNLLAGSADQQWHVVVSEQRHGPYSAEQIRDFLQEGRISANTSVWTDGFADWMPLRETDLAILSTGTTSAFPRQPTSAVGTTKDSVPSLGVQKKSNDLFEPDLQALKRALSAIMTQDPDTKKLFETGSRTYLKLFGGTLNEFIGVNTSLINAALLMKILERLESIDQKLVKRCD